MKVGDLYSSGVRVRMTVRYGGVVETGVGLNCVVEAAEEEAVGMVVDIVAVEVVVDVDVGMEVVVGVEVDVEGRVVDSVVLAVDCIVLGRVVVVKAEEGGAVDVVGGVVVTVDVLVSVGWAELEEGLDVDVVGGAVVVDFNVAEEEAVVVGGFV